MARTPAVPPPDPQAVLPLEVVRLADLRHHPQNYRTHPQDELDHLKASIQAHDIYRNIVVAQDNTILAGAGVVLAAQQLGREVITVQRRPYAADDPRALQILVGDNKIAQRALDDEQMLAQTLQDIAAFDLNALVGTGFDEEQYRLLLSGHMSNGLPQDAQSPEDFPAYDEDIETQYCCPKCGYNWSGRAK